MALERVFGRRSGSPSGESVHRAVHGDGRCNRADRTRTSRVVGIRHPWSGHGPAVCVAGGVAATARGGSQARRLDGKIQAVLGLSAVSDGGVFVVGFGALTTDRHGMAALLLGLIAIAFGAWLYNWLGQHGRWRWPVRLVMLVLLVVGVVFPVQVAAVNGEQHAANQHVPSSSHDIAWQPYSEELIAQLTAEGRGYFIDFTADWCVVCKANLYTAIETPAVADALRAANVVPIMADWTKRDAAITRALSSRGRASVPLYVVRLPGASDDRIAAAECACRSDGIDSLTASALNSNSQDCTKINSNTAYM